MQTNSAHSHTHCVRLTRTNRIFRYSHFIFKKQFPLTGQTQPHFVRDSVRSCFVFVFVSASAYCLCPCRLPTICCTLKIESVSVSNWLVNTSQSLRSICIEIFIMKWMQLLMLVNTFTRPIFLSRCAYKVQSAFFQCDFILASNGYSEFIIIACYAMNEMRLRLLKCEFCLGAFPKIYPATGNNENENENIENCFATERNVHQKCASVWLDSILHDFRWRSNGSQKIVVRRNDNNYHKFCACIHYDTLTGARMNWHTHLASIYG